MSFGRNNEFLSSAGNLYAGFTRPENCPHCGQRVQSEAHLQSCEAVNKRCQICSQNVRPLDWTAHEAVCNAGGPKKQGKKNDQPNRREKKASATVQIDDDKEEAEEVPRNRRSRNIAKQKEEKRVRTPKADKARKQPPRDAKGRSKKGKEQVETERAPGSQRGRGRSSRGEEPRINPPNGGVIDVEETQQIPIQPAMFQPQMMPQQLPPQYYLQPVRIPQMHQHQQPQNMFPRQQQMPRGRYDGLQPFDLTNPGIFQLPGMQSTITITGPGGFTNITTHVQDAYGNSQTQTHVLNPENGIASSTSAVLMTPSLATGMRAGTFPGAHTMMIGDDPLLGLRNARREMDNMMGMADNMSSMFGAFGSMFPPMIPTGHMNMGFERPRRRGGFLASQLEDFMGRGFYEVFERFFGDMEDGQSNAPEGLDEDEISNIPVVTFGRERETDQTSDRSCAVCLCDFDAGEQLRQLQCSHKYHIKCIDQWLLQSGSCPICRKVLDLI